MSKTSEQTKNQKFEDNLDDDVKAIFNSLEFPETENEKGEISWKHNLSGGATPKVLEKSELYDNIAKYGIPGRISMQGITFK